MLLLSCAAAQNTAGPATVQNVTVARDRERICGWKSRSVLRFSPRLRPRCIPTGFCWIFPAPSAQRQDARSASIADGVRRVRTGQHSSSPPVTRVVLDLDQAHPYTLKSEGNRIIVTVSPALNSTKACSRSPVAGCHRGPDRDLPAQAGSTAPVDQRTIRRRLLCRTPPPPHRSISRHVVKFNFGGGASSS